MRAFYALFIARNREFLRDRGTMAWNLLFPFVAVFAIALVFSGDGREAFKVGVLTPGIAQENGATLSRQALAGRAPAALKGFLETRHVRFVALDSEAAAREKVQYHALDMALYLGTPPRYWVNPGNPRGYVLERVLWGATAPNGILREELTGRQIRYVDWLLPGVLAMNMMFSCLWGVGYVIVRYRKGGILRRLKVAPITSLQFISAQIASRLILVLFITAVLFFGMDLLLDFFMLGSVFDLFVTFALGAVCLISLGILIAARLHSLELAGGLLNLATWPMMFLSGVWFSLEGSDQWLVWAARVLPLTPLVDAARKIMVDGATLAGVWPELAVLGAMTAVFLTLGAWLFRWE